MYNWHIYAACYRNNDERFFPWTPEIAIQVAEEFCTRCPVIDLCLAEARRHRSVGVWGGRLFVIVPRRREINLLEGAFND